MKHLYNTRIKVQIPAYVTDPLDILKFCLAAIKSSDFSNMKKDDLIVNLMNDVSKNTRDTNKIISIILNTFDVEITTKEIRDE